MGTEKSLKSDPTFSKSINSSRMIILEKLIFPLLGDSTFQRDIELRKIAKNFRQKKLWKLWHFFISLYLLFIFHRTMGCTRGQPYLTPTKYPQMDSNPVTLKGEGGLSCSPLEAYFKLFWHFEIQITKWILRIRWIYLLIFLVTIQKVHNWKKEENNSGQFLLDKFFFRRKFKTVDVPSSVSKGAPDFCTVYVIAKGKISSVRSASRPVPKFQPPRTQMENQAKFTPDQTTDAHFIHNSNNPRGPVYLIYSSIVIFSFFYFHC